MNMISAIRSTTGTLKSKLHVLYLASRHPETPWFAKAFIFLVVAYAVSPVDLIPDFIPILGYVDDLIVLPIGIYLAIQMIPVHVMNECRSESGKQVNDKKVQYIGLGLVLLLWTIIAAILLKVMRSSTML